MAEWIDVKDRLPEGVENHGWGVYSARVLVVVNLSNFNFPEPGIAFARLCRYQLGEAWSVEGWNGAEVSHWMPIPPVPTEVQREGGSVK